MRTIEVHQKRDALAVLRVTDALAIPSDVIVTEQTKEALVESAEALQQRHLQMRHVWRETTPQNNLLVSVAAVAAPLLKSALAKRSATTRPSRWISGFGETLL